MLTEKLEKFGLSTKEARVYLSLLELGTAIVSDISIRSKINRSTTYSLLESLIKRNLVSVAEKNRIRFYTPFSPDKLVEFVKTLSRQYNDLVTLGESLLPELNLVYKAAKPKPRAKFLDGIEGLREAYEDTLTSKETILAYASIENMHAALPGYFPEYYKRRAEKNIHIRAIFPDTLEAKERIKYNKEEKRTAYLVSKDRYSFTPEINIYDNKIVFMSLVEKFALIIESGELADAFKKSFELAWEGAKSFKKINEK